MNSGDQDAKERIIKAAAEILDEVYDVDKITVRQVAERANVGIGLINYHFKSKDNLLGVVVANMMAEKAVGFITPGNYSDFEPVTKLKAMLKELYSFGSQYEKLNQFTIMKGIQSGDIQTQLFIIPVLREIFGNNADEMHLRILAMQIILPLQVTALCPSAFKIYSGIELHNEIQRNNFIDNLINNLVKENK
ncbi:MAG: TetR family transcriptional regulator [Eubacterium sp.]|jgi:AcrR family transcriptional regulator|nr:TetR family transcriptional regulator [Eubacterium sp.]